jgi:thiol-disulfide isomerase/thioredoxin
MKFKFFAALAAACATTFAAQAGHYKVVTQLSDDEDGAMAFIVNYDTGAKIDSILVSENVAVFEGEVTTPVAARIIIDGARFGTFILEDGTININGKTREVSGGALNTKSDELDKISVSIGERLKAAANDDEKKAIYAEYTETMNKTMLDNIDNPIGYLLLLDAAYEMSPDELIAFVEAHPTVKQYARVNKLLVANERKAATMPGHKFADFEIAYNGESHKLSDVVGKGDFVLVDFWASWCGPCIRQTAVIKDIYKEYKDKGLKVLGVAVWDEPDNTKRAIKQHELPWECWLNGGNVPTDIYGISGIPCIILFGPDGTILSRDKQDDALRADVKAALEQ